MLCTHGRSARFIVLAACGLIFAATSGIPVSRAQNPQMQGPPGQYPSGQYPPNRPQPVASQCQIALATRVSADAGRRVSVILDTQSPYPVNNGRQGLRGRMRYGIGGPNTWRSGNYDCVVNPARNRVVRVTYNPRANNTGWPGGPGYPGGPYPGGPGPGGPYPGGPGVGNYPRVRVDTSGRGAFNSKFAANVRITRGWVDSTGRPSVAFSGGNFRITFYGTVDRSDGNREFSMQITGSDRGDAQGRADVRLNRDRNEVEMINVNGRMGRSNFTGNFSR
jgi:hypothetical protein